MSALDELLDGLLFVEGVRSVPGERSRVVVRAATGFEALSDIAVKRSALDARQMHFVDAPDKVAVTADSAVWSWWMEDRDPAAVADLTCKVPADDPLSHELFVCCSLRWGEVSVTLDGVVHGLPLTRKHLVCKCFAEDGATASPALRLDGSMLVVFGYSLDDGVHALGADELAGDHAWVIVAVELVCARPRVDVDPWGLALGAPMHPRLSVRASRALERVEAELRLERPAETTMVGCEADIEERFRGLAERTIDATWVTHTNREGIRAGLGWDDLYDRVSSGDLRAVAVDPAQAATVIAPGAVLLRSLQRERVPEGAGVVPSEAWRLETPELRVREGQGEVDGVVLAPRLRAPDEVTRALRWWRLRDVWPLPVSAHDALHVVWRWPRSSPGVSVGQRVEVSRHEAVLRYGVVRDTALAAGTWVSFFEHGAFFGLALRAPRWNAAHTDAAFALPTTLSEHAHEAWFDHWIGRYCVAGAQGPSERLEVIQRPHTDAEKLDSGVR